MKETSPENESLSPRTRETSPNSPTRRRPSRGEPDQLKEDRFVLGEESDPPIVVRDGKTDHTAKRWADRQRGHSTHARDCNPIESEACQQSPTEEG